jgi:cell division protein FtsL
MLKAITIISILAISLLFFGITIYDQNGQIEYLKDRNNKLRTEAEEKEVLLKSVNKRLTTAISESNCNRFCNQFATTTIEKKKK